MRVLWGIDKNSAGAVDTSNPVAIAVSIFHLPLTFDMVSPLASPGPPNEIYRNLDGSRWKIVEIKEIKGYSLWARVAQLLQLWCG